MSIVFALPALQDNYIWIIANASQAIVIDPGVAESVRQILQEKAWQLQAILLTHHHGDHCNGAVALASQFSVPIYGPKEIKIAGIYYLQEGEVFANALLTLKVLAIPGHTEGHIAYYGDGKLFCGDTLFTGGCGRLFEGTAAELYCSLQKLSQLPEETLIYCGHEYTLNNLRFARTVEPDNAALQQRWQIIQQQLPPTVPATLKLEKETNPFLRCQQQQVQFSVSTWAGRQMADAAETFCYLRQWKDQFR